MSDMSLGDDKKSVKFGRRVVRLLLTPAKEFERIAPEPETIGAMLTGWIIPLTLLMVVGNVIGALAFGISPGNRFGRFYPVLSEVPLLALPLLAQSVAMPFVMAFVINVLAGFFGGQRNYVQAVRTAAYVSTPAWLVGIFGPAWQLDVFKFIPPLSVGLFIGVLGSVYLLWRALPRMMKASSGLFYAAAVSAVMFVLWIPALLVTFGLISALMRNFGPGG
jgi:hypothetical protein